MPVKTPTAGKPLARRLPGGSVPVAEKLFAPLKIAALIELAQEAGISPVDVLVNTGLSAQDVHNPDARTSILQLVQVARNALRLSPDSALGLKVGLRMHASAYGMYGYLLLCAETMRRAFDLAYRYRSLATPVMHIEWEESADVVKWIVSPRADHASLNLTEGETAFFLDMQFGIHVILAIDTMGAWCRPTVACYAAPAPPRATQNQVALLLGCPVHYEQPRNELHYPREWLSRTPSLANAITATQMSETCARLMEDQVRQSGYSGRVYQAMTRTPGHFPDIESLAASLFMTSRTLRRKLEAEGTSYHELMNRVRQALAEDYLSARFLDMQDIAVSLGFSDASSFRHAFKRWTGMTPVEYRDRGHPSVR